MSGKRLIITQEQFKKLNEQDINIGARANGKNVSDIVSAAQTPEMKKSILAANPSGNDAKMTVSTPNSDETIAPQHIDVAPNQSVQDAIRQQYNPNYKGDVEIDGNLAEGKRYTKKELEKLRAENIRKIGKAFSKKELNEFFKR